MHQPKRLSKEEFLLQALLLHGRTRMNDGQGRTTAVCPITPPASQMALAVRLHHVPALAGGSIASLGPHMKIKLSTAPAPKPHPRSAGGSYGAPRIFQGIFGSGGGSPPPDPVGLGLLEVAFRLAAWLISVCWRCDWGVGVRDKLKSF
jgi:hypothetical protein